MSRLHAQLASFAQPSSLGGAPAGQLIHLKLVDVFPSPGATVSLSLLPTDAGSVTLVPGQPTQAPFAAGTKVFLFVKYRDAAANVAVAGPLPITVGQASTSTVGVWTVASNAQGLLTVRSPVKVTRGDTVVTRKTPLVTGGWECTLQSLTFVTGGLPAAVAATAADLSSLHQKYARLKQSTDPVLTTALNRAVAPGVRIGDLYSGGPIPALNIKGQSMGHMPFLDGQVVFVNRTFNAKTCPDVRTKNPPVRINSLAAAPPNSTVDIVLPPRLQSAAGWMTLWLSLGVAGGVAAGAVAMSSFLLIPELSFLAAAVGALGSCLSLATGLTIANALVASPVEAKSVFVLTFAACGGAASLVALLSAALAVEADGILTATPEAAAGDPSVVVADAVRVTQAAVELSGISVGAPATTSSPLLVTICDGLKHMDTYANQYSNAWTRKHGWPAGWMDYTSFTGTDSALIPDSVYRQISAAWSATLPHLLGAVTLGRWKCPGT